MSAVPMIEYLEMENVMRPSAYSYESKMEFPSEWTENTATIGADGMTTTTATAITGDGEKASGSTGATRAQEIEGNIPPQPEWAAPGGMVNLKNEDTTGEIEGERRMANGEVFITGHGWLTTAQRKSFLGGFNPVNFLIHLANLDKHGPKADADTSEDGESAEGGDGGEGGEANTENRLSDDFDTDISAVDMQEQEHLRVERKRARNRLAARKCRAKKLYRIKSIESKVEGFKHSIGVYQNEADRLERELESMREALRRHAAQGCPIDLTQI